MSWPWSKEAEAIPVLPIAIAEQKIERRIQPTNQTSSHSAIHGSLWGNVAGAFTAGAISELLLYSVDSYKILVQQRMTLPEPIPTPPPLPPPPPPPSAIAATGTASAALTAVRESALANRLVRVSELWYTMKPLFRGSLPIIATGSGPSLGVFFFTYTATKNVLSPRDFTKYASSLHTYSLLIISCLL